MLYKQKKSFTQQFRTSILLVGIALFCLNSPQAFATLLPFPSPDDLTGPVFVQPFAGLSVVSLDGAGNGITESFFSDLPDGSFPSNQVVNILGNFQAFDPFFNPVSLQILGVEVTVGANTFTPDFGEFNFAGHSSLTLTDSFDFDVVTFTSGDLIFAFSFLADDSLAYSFKLVTNLSVGSFATFDDGETTAMPEPKITVLLMLGLCLTFFMARLRGGRRTYHVLL